MKAIKIADRPTHLNDTVASLLEIVSLYHGEHKIYYFYFFHLSYARKSQGKGNH